MATKKYTVTSDEAAELYTAEIGEEIELELSENEERAVIAAGWLEQEASAQAAPEPSEEEEA